MTRYLGNLTLNSVTIASSGTTSGAIDLQGLVLCQIIMPAAFTGTGLTFSSSWDDVTYQVLYNSSNSALSLTVTASRNYDLAPQDFCGCRFLKLISGSTELGNRVIGLVTREAL